jgi:cytochrome c biogenesis protein CcdA
MEAVLLGWIIGLANGMRHACEPDHLAAISTLAAEQRSTRSVRWTIALAARWGLGHALVLFVVGGLLIALRAEMPKVLGDVFELLVAIMLVLLGIRAVRNASRNACEVSSPHLHADGSHSHTHSSATSRRPLFIGMVHGLAGSGAVTAMVIAALPGSPAHALAFIAIYGIGAMIGMSLVAAIASVPLARITRHLRGTTYMLRAAGALSMGVGAFWAWPIARRLLGV